MDLNEYLIYAWIPASGHDTYCKAMRFYSDPWLPACAGMTVRGEDSGVGEMRFYGDTWIPACAGMTMRIRKGFYF